MIFTKQFGENFTFKLEKDWRAVVIFVEDLSSSLDYHDRWKRALNSLEIGKTAKFLIELELSFAMDTSCAERWFSLMNLIKSKRRSRMNTDLLNDLMFICTHAPKSISQLKSILLDVLVLWESESKRGRYKGKWEEEALPVIQDLESEQEIANEVRLREINLDKPNSFEDLIEIV